MEGSAAGAESDAMNAGDTPLVAVTFTVPVAGCEKEPGRTLGVCSVWTAALSAVTAACRFVTASVALAVLGAPITRTRPPTTGRRNFAMLRPRYLIAYPRNRRGGRTRQVGVFIPLADFRAHAVIAGLLSGCRDLHLVRSLVEAKRLSVVRRA